DPVDTFTKRAADFIALYEIVIGALAFLCQIAEHFFIKDGSHGVSGIIGFYTSLSVVYSWDITAFLRSYTNGEYQQSVLARFPCTVGRILVVAFAVGDDDQRFVMFIVFFKRSFGQINGLTDGGSLRGSELR